jgi:hypothetical protein
VLNAAVTERIHDELDRGEKFYSQVRYGRFPQEDVDCVHSMFGCASSAKAGLNTRRASSEAVRNSDAALDDTAGFWPKQCHSLLLATSMQVLTAAEEADDARRAAAEAGAAQTATKPSRLRRFLRWPKRAVTSVSSSP